MQLFIIKRLLDGRAIMENSNACEVRWGTDPDRVKKWAIFTDAQQAIDLLCEEEDHAIICECKDDTMDIIHHQVYLNPKTVRTVKACPFCGGPAAFEEIEAKSSDGVYWSVGCEGNGDENPACFGYQNFLKFPTKGEAAAAWNRRAENTL